MKTPGSLRNCSDGWKPAPPPTESSANPYKSEVTEMRDNPSSHAHVEREGSGKGLPRDPL